MDHHTVRTVIGLALICSVAACTSTPRAHKEVRQHGNVLVVRQPEAVAVDEGRETTLAEQEQVLRAQEKQLERQRRELQHLRRQEYNNERMKQ